VVHPDREFSVLFPCPALAHHVDTKEIELALVQAWREAGALFSEREKAALAWAETVTRVADTHVPDEDFAAAAAVFGEKELADLTMAISLMNAFNRLAISFRRGPEAAVAGKG
jgi:alkylhydroperoxidase family enzyme